MALLKHYCNPERELEQPWLEFYDHCPRDCASSYSFAPDPSLPLCQQGQGDIGIKCRTSDCSEWLRSIPEEVLLTQPMVLLNFTTAGAWLNLVNNWANQACVPASEKWDEWDAKCPKDCNAPPPGQAFPPTEGVGICASGQQEFGVACKATGRLQPAAPRICNSPAGSFDLAQGRGVAMRGAC
mmetsp:Transcript_35661/g.112520  ORF Transcript_35661/g.112520 Transcript_35661/m.112520 type:complete len:183 (+) Transcript_35661:302-850(+)